MKTHWLDDFMRWFFNASPLWVDERKIWKPTPEFGSVDDHRQDGREDIEPRRSNRITRSSRS